METVRANRRLEAGYLKETADRLRARIEARFPERGLAATAADVSRVVDESLEARQHRAQRMQMARVLSVVIITALVVAAAVAFALLVQSARDGLGEPVTWPSFFESTINDVVFVGIAIYFVWLWPRRIEKRATLAKLHELRSLAHVIDMHQLTKDPERLRPDFEPTEASYTADLTASELSYYLDYCSELLSVVGKIAALHGEHATDSTVLQAMEGIEDLTTGMSRKIWQKIALLPQNRGEV